MSGKKNRQYPRVRGRKVPDRRQSGLSQETNTGKVWKPSTNQRSVLRAYIAYLDEGNAYLPINHSRVKEHCASAVDIRPRTIEGWNHDPNWTTYVDQTLMERSKNMRGQVFAAMNAIVHDTERCKDKDRIAAAKVILDNLPSEGAKGEADLAALMASLKSAPEGSEITALYEAGEDVGRIRFEMRAQKFRNRQTVERFQNAGEKIGAVESSKTKTERLSKAHQMLDDIRRDYVRPPFEDCTHDRKVCETCKGCTRWRLWGFTSMADVEAGKRDGRLVKSNRRWRRAEKVKPKVDVEVIQDADFSEVKKR